MAIVPGYHAYFSFSKVKLGYSGVAVYVKDTFQPQPIHAYEGITGVLDGVDNNDFVYDLNTPAEILDAEGRCIILDFGFFVLFNIYFPNYSNETRAEFKMDYHACVQKRADYFMNKRGKQVLIVGDVNAVHEEIDHCDPKQSMLDHGIDDFKDLPHRRWLDNMIEPKGEFIDTTRHYHPKREKMYTCWNTRINARPSNYGTRIDYILASSGLRPWLQYSDIQPNIMGSDHCPVYAEFLSNMPQIAANHNENDTRTNSSLLLSTNFPEFKEQNKLSNYFLKRTEQPLQQQAITTLKRNHTHTNTNNDSHQNKKTKRNHITVDNFFIKKDSNILKATSSNHIHAEEQKETIKSTWNSIFKPKEIPKCKFHNEPCIERTVTKKGPNLGRIFYICSKPVGPQDGPKEDYSCNFFLWKQQSKK
ncbi:Endonuclease/exonuclease/phosphatase [Cokeromyces recurvatus]|uniref:Endonuclease/exonuclease/phosphatase n=1 Tax=Cokeromyces recurvatus TaxID=90255 RepID=UPI00221E9E65|nr:Endonuclease/exonuclease/phosphatase [Cokeromyces recurvatus]KAI7905284.1 Endonuclease/exonuclease/phosphatase [Cokeromyces recurvatus]